MYCSWSGRSAAHLLHVTSAASGSGPCFVECPHKACAVAHATTIPDDVHLVVSVRKPKWGYEEAPAGRGRSLADNNPVACGGQRPHGQARQMTVVVATRLTERNPLLIAR